MHSDLDGERLFLRQWKLKQPSNIVAEDIANAIVEKHNRQHQKEQRDAVAYQLRLHLTHHAAHNQRQANDTASRHHRLQRLETLRLTHKIIDKFIVEVVEECETMEHAGERERLRPYTATLPKSKIENKKIVRNNYHNLSGTDILSVSGNFSVTYK